MNSLAIRFQVLAGVLLFVASVVVLPIQVNAADLGDGGWYDAGSYDSWGDVGSYDSWYDAGSYDSWSDVGTYGDWYDAGATSGDWYDAGATSGDWYDAGTSDWYDAGYADYYDAGYNGYYGGGYSSGCYGCGGYSVKPSYTTPGCYGCGGSYTVKPTPSGPSNTSSVNTNNNTNVNVNNNTAIAVAQVQIGSQQTSYPTQPAPYCTIYQAQYGNYGNAVYLSWTSSNASSAYLSGYGSVAVNGSQTVYTSGYQTYTLTVYGYNGQQATCQTTVQKTVTPYVSLTQIPYTGFDFGPFGNAMYWAGMIVFALAGAYLAVYYVPSLAFAGTKRGFAPVVAPKAPILVEKEAALEKVAPIVASLKKAGTNDAMAIVKSTDGSMPKIVIERF